MGLKKPPHDRPLKRGRIEEISVKGSPSSNFPRFRAIHSEFDKPLSRRSLFLVHKVFVSALGDNSKAKKVLSGDLLVEIKDKKQSIALLQLIVVADYKVTVSPRCSLNMVREHSHKINSSTILKTKSWMA